MQNRNAAQDGPHKEASADITFYFDKEGAFREVSVASDSDQLLSVLERIDWRSVPSPTAYMLRMRGLTMQLRIVKGEPSLCRCMSR
jgi:hypothetical protein